MSDMTKVCGLWIETSKKDGQRYMRGKANGKKYLIFRNTKKEHDKQPDYVLYEAEDAGASASAPKTEAPANNDSNAPF